MHIFIFHKNYSIKYKLTAETYRILFILSSFCKGLAETGFYSAFSFTNLV